MKVKLYAGKNLTLLLWITKSELKRVQDVSYRYMPNQLEGLATICIQTLPKYKLPPPLPQILPDNLYIPNHSHTILTNMGIHFPFGPF